MPVLAFDMDGTLTAPKQPIDPEMAKAISYLADRHTVWIITGASRKNCDEQLGSLVQTVDRIYCSSATEAWVGNRLILSEPIMLPDGFNEFVEKLEVLGITHSQRRGVVTLHFDSDSLLERDDVVEEIKMLFPSLQAHCAGRTSVDVLQRDAGKHKAIEGTCSNIWYWGDECHPEGNDWTIAEQLQIVAGNRVFAVKNWQDTLHQLKEIFNV